MALGDPYATVGDLAARLNNDEPFPDLLDAASRAVEAFTGRQFNKATVATARRFRAVDLERLPVDDFHTVTGLAVSVDGTAWTVADVDPRPWDGIVNGQSGWPFFNLFAINRTWPFDRRATITVTAQWGWPAVPQAIRQTTLDVAVAMFGTGGASYPVRSEAIDGYSVTYQPTSDSAEVPPEMVKAVSYRRKRFGVA
jgi:hypothetical protein